MANGNKSYSQKLRDPRWQKKRLSIMERDNFKCVHCSDEKTTLNVHHKKYTGEPWEAPDCDLETVCRDCHIIIEDIECVIKNKELNIVDVFKRKHDFGFALYMVCKGVVGIITYNNKKSNTTAIPETLLEDILKTMKNG